MHQRKPEHSGRRTVLMVRRKSTVRFRKGAPGQSHFSFLFPVTPTPGAAPQLAPRCSGLAAAGLLRLVSELRRVRRPFLVPGRGPERVEEGVRADLGAGAALAYVDATDSVTVGAGGGGQVGWSWCRLPGLP